MPGGSAGAGGGSVTPVTTVTTVRGGGYAPKGGPSTVTFHAIVNPAAVRTAQHFLFRLFIPSFSFLTLFFPLSAASPLGLQFIPFIPRAALPSSLRLPCLPISQQQKNTFSFASIFLFSSFAFIFCFLFK